MTIFCIHPINTFILFGSGAKYWKLPAGGGQTCKNLNIFRDTRLIQLHLGNISSAESRVRCRINLSSHHGTEALEERPGAERPAAQGAPRALGRDLGLV